MIDQFGRLVEEHSDDTRPAPRTNELGFKDAVQLLDRTLAEEKKTDEALSKLAMSVVNQEAEAA